MVRTLALLALAGWPSSAAAQDGPALRVVVLPKVVANGQTRDAAALEAWVNQAVTGAGHRVVSLDASLRAQAFALSDAISAGQVPDELTVLNADAAWSVQLSCDQDQGHRQIPGITYYCTFSRSVVRISQGDAVYSETASWHDIFGANIAQALFGGNVRKRAPELLAGDVTSWSGSWSGDGVWDADLRVTQVPDRSRAEVLAERLSTVPGVTGTRLVAFSRNVSQLSLRGEGGDALARLAEHIEADPSIGLVVTHQTDRLLHAELDLGRMHRRGARILVVPPTSAPPKSVAAMVAESGPALVQAALANVSWLEPSAVVTGPAGSAKPSAQQLREAAAADEPWVVAVAFRSARGSDGGEQWLVTASLVDSDGGADLLAANGRDADPFAALDAAVRDLDQQFAAAASDPLKRRALGLPDGAADALGQGVRVTSFELEPLFPSRPEHNRTEGVGTLRITNGASTAMTAGELEVRAGDRVLATVAVPEVAAGAEASVPVRIEAAPELDPTTSHTLQAQATLSFQLGESFGRARAYATLLVHRRNTIDWSEPSSVAAFVDATDPVVRGLATAGAKVAPEGGAPKPLARAAALHAAVWGGGLRYVRDPVETAFDASIDDVQHPRQTLERLAGDCDDLTVLLASLYESVGLSTVVITTPGHVLLGVDSGLLAGGHVLVDLPADRFVEVDGALFVPVEATAVQADFSEAWRLGAELVQKAGGSARAFRTRDAWRRFPAVGLVDAPPARLEARSVDATAVADALPQLRIPADPPGDDIAGPAVTWLGGAREEGAAAAAEACNRGVTEACYNLAVMLSATSGKLASEPFPAPLVDALCLLPQPVVGMLLDQGGLGLGDDASEASEAAEARRRLEEVLRKARERQAELEQEGLTDVKLEAEAVAGRRGREVSEPDSVAPLFFFAAVAGE